MLILAAGLILLIASFSDLVPMKIAGLELAILSGAALASYLRKRDQLIKLSGCLTAAMLIPFSFQFIVGDWNSGSQRQLMVYLLIGTSFFAIGLFISLLKGGLSDSFHSKIDGYWSDFSSRFAIVEKPEVQTDG